MRVFVDTNVLVSAFATRGLCADVFRLVINRHELIVGEVVLEELEAVLKDKLQVPVSTVEELLRHLREHTVVPRPGAAPIEVAGDPSDAWVLASAIGAGADVLVTGDRDLLDLPARAELTILTPRALWNRMRGADSLEPA